MRRAFLIIDEVPAVGFMQSTANFLAANQGNGRQQGFFEKETTPALLKNHKAALTDMIRPGQKPSLGHRVEPAQRASVHQRGH